MKLLPIDVRTLDVMEPWPKPLSATGFERYLDIAMLESASGEVNSTKVYSAVYSARFLERAAASMSFVHVLVTSMLLLSIYPLYISLHIATIY